MAGLQSSLSAGSGPAPPLLPGSPGGPARGPRARRYSPFPSNVERSIPWRTLTGRQQLYAALRAQFPAGELAPGWECWTGVSGICYARLRNSSPPVVVRAATVTGLAAAIREEQVTR